MLLRSPKAVGRSRKRVGLTLMELIVVLTILVALAAIVVPMFPNVVNSGQSSAATIETRQRRPGAIESARSPLFLRTGDEMRIIIGISLAAIVGLVALAQPPKKDDTETKDKKKGDAQSTYEPKSGPGEGQKFLQQFVGDWEVAKAFYPRGGGEPNRAKGECKQTMIHGGRFLQSDFVFGEGDSKTTGTGMIGFEPGSSKFTSVWVDSRQTRMSFRQAQDKFDGKQIVLFGKGLGDEKQRYESKTVTKLEDDGNKIVHRQFGTGPDGQERLVMELIMTRKAVPAK